MKPCSACEKRRKIMAAQAKKIAAPVKAAYGKIIRNLWKGKTK